LKNGAKQYIKICGEKQGGNPRQKFTLAPRTPFCYVVSQPHQEGLNHSGRQPRFTHGGFPEKTGDAPQPSGGEKVGITKTF
jgi:hypothetical protein